MSFSHEREKAFPREGAEFNVAPEALQVGQLVKDVEAELARHAVPPRQPGARAGWCVLVSGLVSEMARTRGMQAPNFQAADLHSALIHAAIPVDDPLALERPREAAKRAAFSHRFSVVMGSEAASPFLVDLTYTQFMQSDGQIYQRPLGCEGMPGIANDHPLAQTLLQEGYFALTDESLAAYLEITTNQAGPTHIKEASVALLAGVPRYYQD